MEQNTSKENLTKAIQLIKEGKKKEGGQILLEIVKSEPRNETAWLWLSTCSNNVDQKIYCLKKVLDINPDNEKAKSAYEKLINLNSEPDLSQILSQEKKDEYTPHDGKKKTQIIPIIVIVGGVVLLILALFIIIFGKNTLNKITTFVTPTKCNNELLTKVKETPIIDDGDVYSYLGEFSETFSQLIHLDNLKNLEWTIEERGTEGCVITLFGEKNAITYNLFQFYVDLSENKVSADNQDTQDLFEFFWNINRDYLGGIYLD